jgi:ubiquinone/menaquinone biosynthesis C-methylase UbiE
MDEGKRRAQRTYNAAADHFDDPALGFWDRYGHATVERLGLRRGARVLDVCAGAGASALPAAARVAPTGQVVAVDLADNLLALARNKAERAGLSSVLSTRCTDVDTLDDTDGGFDAVMCVFGLFFLPDMGGAAARLWRLVAPGGTLAVTTWGPRLWEPANSVFWAEVSALRPELNRAYQPWDALTDPAVLGELLRAAGTPDPRIVAMDDTYPLRSAEDFWTIVLGSGYRATHDALTPHERALIHDRIVAELTASKVTALETNVIYASATKSPSTTTASHRSS